MTVRFEFNGKKYCAFLGHQTTCHIVEELPRFTPSPFSNPLVATSSSKCHDLDHFDKETGERKALARALFGMSGQLGVDRSHRAKVFEQYEAALEKRIKREKS